MRKKSVARVVMIVAGFLAVCAILVSPTLSPKQVSNAKVEQKSATDSKEVPGPTIQAPTEAIPGTAMKMDEPSVPLVTELKTVEVPPPTDAMSPAPVARFLKVLLRTIIAPNAP